MSFILVPKQGEDIQINGWNWRPTLLLISDLLDDETYHKMEGQGCGGKADAELCRRIADVVDAKLDEMHPGDRMLPDLSVTSSSFEELVAAGESYSASYKWLRDFSAFCRSCGGFEVM